jgi:hypothetical protein
MGAIGWIWAWLMLLGGVRAHLTHALPHDLIWAMMVSGVIALPLLWNRNNGIFAAVAPSGIVRAGLALLVLAVAGIAHPSAMSGLIPA